MRNASLVLAFGFVIVLGLLVALVLGGASEQHGVASFSLAFLGIGAAIGLGLGERR